MSNKEQEQIEKLCQNIESLLKEASPLPWKNYSEKFSTVQELAKAVAKSVRLNDSAEFHWIEPDPGNGTWPAATGNGALSKVHAELIVTVMNNLPTLIEYIRSLENRVDDLNYQICYPDGD